MRKVKLGEIEVGRPLPWPVLDADGNELAPEGRVFEKSLELDALFARGLFTNGREQVRVDSAVFDKVSALPEQLHRILRTILAAEGEDVTMRVTRLAQAIQRFCQQDPDALLAALHVRYEEPFGVVESLHAAALSELLAAAKGLPPAQRLHIVCGALTHDVGFLRQGDALQRQRNPLTDAQWGEVHQHPINGERLLRKAGVSNQVWLDVVRHHHERLDGGGYPNKLSGEQISLAVRILAIADIYAAMVKPRGYRDAHLGKDAVREIFMERGSGVDEELTQLFVRRIGIFPPGAFVKLRNEEIAVVIRQGENATQPRICSILSPHGKALPKPIFRDTSEKRYAVTDMVPHQRYRSLLGMLNVLWRNA